MKKVSCIVLVLCVLLAVVLWSQSRGNRNSILGSWETEMQVSVLGVSGPDGREQTAEVLYCFAFYEDGTGRRNITAREEYADRIPDIEESFTYLLEGDILTLTQENGNTQVFTVSFSGQNLILDGRTHMELVRKK